MADEELLDDGDGGGDWQEPPPAPGIRGYNGGRGQIRGGAASGRRGARGRGARNRANRIASEMAPSAIDNKFR
eukprot:7912544-Lingulodinium_polyedra.AAC.1